MPRPTVPSPTSLAALLADTARDVRLALRAHRRSPGFFAAAVLCLGVALGVDVATFGVLNALALRPLAGVAAQDGLVALHGAVRTADGVNLPRPTLASDLAAFRDGLRGIADVAGETSAIVPLGDASSTDVALRRAVFVSGDYFAVIGTRPALGRLPIGDDGETVGRAPVAVVAYDFWRTHLGGRADVIGRPLRVGGTMLTVVAVAPRGFTGLRPADVLARDATPVLWAPLGMLPLVRQTANAGGRDASPTVGLVARLRPGATPELVAAAAERVARASSATTATLARGATPTVRATPVQLGPTDTRASVLGAIAALLAVPTIVLLVACANLAGLQLARASLRTREIAIRRALGATRARLVRLLVAESALLAAAGGAGALVIAQWMPALLRVVGLTVAVEHTIDGRVLAFATGAVLLATLLTGLAPALGATRGAGRPTRSQRALVVGQIAASAALLAVCALFVLGARRGAVAELGIAREGRVLATYDLDALGLDSAHAHALQTAVLHRLAARGDVVAVGATTFLPLGNAGETHATTRDGGDGWIKVVPYTGDWFAAAGVPLRAGVAAREGEGVVVSASLAGRLWGGRSPLGRTITLRDEGELPRTYEIVGIVGDLRFRADAAPDGAIFVPTARPDVRSVVWVHVRARRGADAVAAVRAELAALAPTLLPPDVRDADTIVRDALRPIALAADALGALGVLALGLAAVGVYALVAYLVARRAREIGVRMALGARRAHVVRGVLRDAMGLAAVGVAVGLPIAVIAAGVLRQLLYGVSPFAPGPFAAAALVLAGVATVAALGPALRASRTDPLVVLRQD